MGRLHLECVLIGNTLCDVRISGKAPPKLLSRFEHILTSTVVVPTMPDRQYLLVYALDKCGWFAVLFISSTISLEVTRFGWFSLVSSRDEWQERVDCVAQILAIQWALFLNDVHFRTTPVRAMYSEEGDSREDAIAFMNCLKLSVGPGCLVFTALTDQQLALKNSMLKLISRRIIHHGEGNLWKLAVDFPEAKFGGKHFLLKALWSRLGKGHQISSVIGNCV